jgi:hypothetical protein
MPLRTALGGRREQLFAPTKERWTMTTDIRLDATAATWRKSSHSGKEGNCVEVACPSGATRAIRDSHDPDGPALMCPTRQLAAFLTAAGNGDFHV